MNHVRKHTGDTQHFCEICNKSFTRKEHYANHKMWHTGEYKTRFISKKKFIFWKHDFTRFVAQ